PSAPPGGTVLDVWFNVDIPELTPIDPNEEKWALTNFRDLGRTMFIPWLARHPGVTLNITQHGWDFDLRQNQLAALAAGLIPDVSYGEAYVSEFVQLGVYSPVSNDVAQLFADAA